MAKLATCQANILQLMVIQHMQFEELPPAAPIADELADNDDGC